MTLLLVHSQVPHILRRRRSCRVDGNTKWWLPQAEWGDSVRHKLPSSEPRRSTRTLCHWNRRLQVYLEGSWKHRRVRVLSWAYSCDRRCRIIVKGCSKVYKDKYSKENVYYITQIVFLELISLFTLPSRRNPHTPFLSKQKPMVWL